MAIIVEDGTGLENANSYISVADADSYFLNRNNSEWAAKSAEEKEAGLLYATTYLDSNFIWIGNIKDESQALGWPRRNAYDHEGRLISGDTVPTKVKYACAELSLLSANSGSTLSSSSTSSGRVKRQKVGSLEVEYFNDEEAETIASTASETQKLALQLLFGLAVNANSEVAEPTNYAHKSIPIFRS